MATPALKVLVIVGPTGSGKTELAIRLARTFDGEIICADSRTVYRGMDIGTAKPTRAERRRVRHHLIDIRDPNESYSVAEFQRDAERCIRELHERGKLPIVVGGTGLYIRALVDRLRIPPVPADLLLRARCERMSTAALLRELARRDPVTFRWIDQRNRRRLIRALEVCRMTGQPFSAQRAIGDSPFTFLEIGIQRTRTALSRRIDCRIRTMVRRGLMREVERLVERYGPDIEPLRGIIYREVAEYLPFPPTNHTHCSDRSNGWERKQIDRQRNVRALMQRIMVANHRYARHQLTWFRRDSKIHWIRTAREAERLVRRWLART